ncbi:MAG: hypothetical protein RSE54_10560 [Ruthenibacterium sp.]
MTPRELRKKVLERCRDDCVYYAETYVHIENKDDPNNLIIPLKLWDGQRNALLSIVMHRLNAILKARQLGITWLVLCEASRLLLCWSGRTVVALSRTEDEAKELVRRLAVIFRYMPELIAEDKNVPPGWCGPVFFAKTMDLTVTFPGEPESTFKAFPSSPNSGRSFTADLVILDEWAFQQWAEEIWKALFPVVNRTTGGRVIGLSTIERGTLFEEIFTNPDNGFNKIFLPWNTDPTRDKAWYMRTLAAMGEDKTLQEYPATVEEALTVPGGAFFPEVKKETHEREIEDAFWRLPVSRYACVDYGLDMFSVHWVAVNSAGKARVYREFDSANLTIGQACDAFRTQCAEERIASVLAPPDLWNREQVNGRSRAQLFSDGGMTLVKTSNDFAAGCAGLKSWLLPIKGEDPGLTFEKGAAPNLFRCLQKIQKDEKRPDVYAKQPHNLTHDIDSLRCFAVWWVYAPDSRAKKNKSSWEPDLFEDYENADEAGKAYLIEKYGDPF